MPTPPNTTTVRRSRYLPYARAFSDESFGYGSALAYLIVLFIFVLATFYIRALRAGQFEAA